MARLILKSPYLKCDGSHSVSGYLRYIGTRERVELLPDDRPPTRKQEQLVRKLVKDFPSSKELDEYLDYAEKPTKANASVFITRALEENWPEVQQADGYMKYIAPVHERSGWVTTASLETRTAWTWSRPCWSWISIPATCGHTSSP